MNEGKAEFVCHPFEPVFDAHSRVLILGSIPSPKSRENGFYYGHPQNRFWRVLSTVLEEPFPQTVGERRALLLRRGIALWDVLSGCEISGALDSTIRNAQVNDISRVLNAAPIDAIFTTGRKSTEIYKKYLFSRVGRASIYLPSPSAANCRGVGLPELCESYRVILDYLEE